MELGGGGGGGGESAAKRARLSSDVDSSGASAGEDRFSVLPDDVLISIILRLRTHDAARTRVLSRQWRRIWALVPNLSFPKVPSPHRLRDELDAREAPVHDLSVNANGATAESLGVWLPAAARRVSGRLSIMILGGEGGGGGFLELPCFEKATSLCLWLDFLGLAVPPTGVFTRLTSMHLSRVWFRGPGDLGDAVSSPRCPCLQRLYVYGARGLAGLSIHSDSIGKLELKYLRALSQLTVVAPTLIELILESCFAKSGPVAKSRPLC